MITFTKNVNKTTRSNGENILGYYFRASKLSKAPYYPNTNLKDLLAFYDSKYPTFIEYLGDMLNYTDINKMIKVAQAVAAENNLAYPIPARWANQISNVAGAIDYSNVISGGLEESYKDVKNFSKGYLWTLAIVSVITVSFVIYQKSGGKLPKLNFKKL